MADRQENETLAVELIQQAKNRTIYIGMDAYKQTVEWRAAAVLRNESDMAALGRAVMAALETIQQGEGPFKDWTPAECPSEILLDMHEEILRFSTDLEKVQRELDAASHMIGEVESRFPNWQGFRDLIDCIDVTLHQLRDDARGLRAGRAE